MYKKYKQFAFGETFKQNIAGIKSTAK